MKKKSFDRLIESLKQALEHAEGARKELRTTLAYKGYRARIEWSDEDQVFVGRVLDKTDIISFHGETEAEAEKAFREAVDFYIEASEKPAH